MLCRRLFQSVFEDTFGAFDDEAWFQYFPSFRRARVNYGSAKAAASARVHLHETTLCGAVIKCYFIQVPLSVTHSLCYLQRPEYGRSSCLSSIH